MNRVSVNTLVPQNRIPRRQRQSTIYTHTKQTNKTNKRTK